MAQSHTEDFALTLSDRLIGLSPPYFGLANFRSGYVFGLFLIYSDCWNHVDRLG